MIGQRDAGSESGNGNGGNGGRVLPISLCMIVRNESRFLAECLRSAAPYVAEMIVVDTGSTDDTIAIGEAFGANVLRMTWKDDFAAARNRSLAAAGQPWILVLDADERLVVASVENWEVLLADSSKWGYYVKLHSWVGGGSGAGSVSVVTDAVCRLFRNNAGVRFRGIIHEEAASSIIELGGEERLGLASGIEIWHEGYRDEIIAERRKFARNRRLLSLALADEPNDPILRYAAGTELFTAGRYSEALKWLEPLVDAAIVQDQGYGSDLLLKIVHGCRAAGRLHDAARYAKVGVLRYPDFADMHTARGEVLFDLDDAEAALGCAVAAASIGMVPANYSTAEGAGTYRSRYMGGAALERLYRFEEAAQAYVSALAHKPNYWPAWQRLLLLGLLHAPIRKYWRQAEEWLRAADCGDEALAAGDRYLISEMEAILSDLGLDKYEGEAVWTLLHGLQLNSSSAASPAVTVVRPLLRSVWLARQGEAPGMLEAWGGPAALLARSPVAEARRCLAAGWTAALGGSWRAAADDFAAATGVVGARPWQQRAAASGLAAAFAAQARGACGAELLPELQSEKLLELLLGTTVLAN
ncbi:glycosyltransferase family 2 protein [Paenibacillus sp. CF384]|uniref:glycosyltransferase family 2 protein n=1 Tax=Paenibacillus sp. CF384 TaxID=1884382 RepID=UPI00089A7CEB|nr:glycosyltransferase family 2 protein [Paenibacillus sp. CF384]SDX95547.1 Glycosyltransferase involved in cell wall bisynthesis [Paenibacillus sp. CF384]